MAWVYILRSERGRLYIGSTSDLPQRIEQHMRGSVHTTKRMGKLELLTTREFATVREAEGFERFLKSRKDPRRVLWYMGKGPSSSA